MVFAGLVIVLQLASMYSFLGSQGIFAQYLR